MITLIAEAKTMREPHTGIDQHELELHTPAGQKTADEIMGRVATLTVSEIAERAKISSKMAVKLHRMAYEFPNKSVGIKAIEAFSGVVFKGFDYDTLSQEQKGRADSEIAIISSLYGWLKPDDIILPYRLEYNSLLAPDNRSLAEYWKKDVTINLVRQVQQNGDTDILDLLPGDAAKSVDRKLVKRFAKIWKVDFKELQPGGEYRTPHSGRLKTLRGELLREIIVRGITRPEQLLTLTTDTFLPLGTPDYPDHIAFCV